MSVIRVIRVRECGLAVGLAAVVGGALNTVQSRSFDVEKLARLLVHVRVDGIDELVELLVGADPLRHVVHPAAEAARADALAVPAD